jgi:hypothetical protein
MLGSLPAAADDLPACRDIRDPSGSVPTARVRLESLTSYALGLPLASPIYIPRGERIEGQGDSISQKNSWA